MDDLFHAYEVRQGDAEICAFLIESTAPENIDGAVESHPTPAATVRLCSSVAIEKIADKLLGQASPKLVVSVHGFNSPRDTILRGFGKSFESVCADSATGQCEIVCIGYRWPSERIGTPFRSAFPAAPTFLWVSLVAGIIALVAASFLGMIGVIWPWLSIVVILAGGLSTAISLTLLLLRIFVYFRDGYRATSFGVPDLVEVIRRIDKRLVEIVDEKGLTDRLDEKGGLKKRVELSFVGHSLGAFVVTNVVRILSDVFSPLSVRASRHCGESGEARAAKGELQKIGNVFTLKHLVLVAPDIPAETLITSRANFLAASLRRFDEAYLFSNEGDVVLRLLSTTANYFSFPTTTHRFGHRLGNICVVLDKRQGYGIDHDVALEKLRVGSLTLAELHSEMGSQRLQDDLFRTFSYFDCTDCVDDDGKGVLTLATRGTGNRLDYLEQLRLLAKYIVGSFTRRPPDVHSGYFDSVFLKRLIYRLACLGFDETTRVYEADTASLEGECVKYQIRALLNR